MELMHHPGLRVNAAAVDDSDAMEVYAESGWIAGPHPDTDPDDPSAIPAVLAPADPVLASKPRMRTNKKG